LARSPWYQEFLRPRGFFWNATAALLRGSNGEGLYFGVKKSLDAGPFGSDEVAAFGEVLPDLRRAASLSRRMRDFETLGMVKLIHERGDPVFELDIWGRVLRVHAFDDRAGPALSIVQRRLTAADRLAQAALDNALAKALARPGVTAAARLPAGPGEWRYLLIVPVLGRARDMFLTAAAVAVLIKPRRRPTPLMLGAGALHDLFNLTNREAAVALRLGDGLSLEAAARSLKIGVGTARNHLKGVFEKTGTKRQSELVALLGVLRP
ncbi:MAG TPA: helix-turn-helix transcriptional regulator, partial [Roseiarcus sp.]|nr:helix-turn-helix transcriptional regulator [Roseiarcus sp.]